MNTFRQYVQDRDNACEAGGILLGTVHGTHMLIEQATAPTARDRRFRTFFERLPFGHKEVADSRWAATQGTVRYLGEWHTHPEDHPRPSGLDRAEWSILAAQRLDKRPMLAVIVGRKSLYVELVPCSGVGSILACIC
ncbi:Mov34/MPN/PAD-1 family protein [Gallaecimonas xiamenensis]